jgi:nucleotide-binding universal stress UspA family protein
MYEKILVPLDGSKVGEAALPNVEDMVLKFASCMGVEITLLQVISDLTFDFLTDNDAAQLPYSKVDLEMIEQMAKKYLESKAEPMRKKGINVHTMVVEGHAPDEIIKAAQKINADLIAMSTHGRSGIGRWALGSITDKVLHESRIPVMTVRANASKSNEK